MFNLSIEEKERNAQKTVVVGMSGGVDSSVAAHILKEQGYNVVGMFMKNWEENDPNGQCTATKDFEDVVKVCEQIDIPYYTVNFSQEYMNNVFEDFVKEYEMGLTPNPDVLCNSEIKFKVFLEKAMELGADYLATGHYCQLRHTDSGPQLIKGVDAGKDQTYFLHYVKKESLTNVLFPVGGVEKSVVRALAEKYDIATKKKKDSTGICFIGERNFRNFLSQYIGIKEGNLETLDGTIVGRHQGMAFYTPGQRKGLGIGAMKESNGEPWFVVGKDVSTNVVHVAQGTRHPALYSDYLICSEINWITVPNQFPYNCCAKVRYRQTDQECTIAQTDQDGIFKIDFAIPQRAIAPGQSVVFYQGDVCLGGGIIRECGPTYYQQQRDLPEILAI